MKIIFTAPFWSPDINSISKAAIYLGTQGHDILVITAQAADSLKGKVTAPAHEIIEGTEFFRPYPNSKDLTWHPQKHWPRIQEKIENFQPDVIVGFGDPFYRLPLKISHHLKTPLVMFFEYLRLDKFSLPIRGGGKIRKYLPNTYQILSNIFRRYLIGQCSAIMFSYYGDKYLIPDIERICPIVRYVPWCTETGEKLETTKRNRKTGIYVGSLEGFKNAAELVEAIPLILEQTATERFIVVGPGEYAPKIKALIERYGSQLEYIEALPRKDALHLLRSAGYGYTPVTDCGLGFIGDCWGTGTPLITTHKLDGFLLQDSDTLIADSVYDLPKTINSLIGSDALFERMHQGGVNRYLSNYTARAVGKQYLQVFKEVVATNKTERIR